MSFLLQLHNKKQKKACWPWVDERSCSSWSSTYHESDYPKITIITPSLNQGQFIEETIRSVLLQNYPNLEYIIIDGGSTDHSIDIIKKYQSWIDYWVSEADEGQSDAINKGFIKATGEIIGWLNADDYYLPGALFEIARHLDNKQPRWLLGATDIVNTNGHVLYTREPPKVTEIQQLFLTWTEHWFAQQSTFWNAKLMNQAGLLNEDLDYVMDVDYWYRLYQQIPPQLINSRLACCRTHSQAKTIACADKSWAEFVNWTGKHLFQATEEQTDIIAQALTEIRRLQLKNEQFEHIKRHRVLGGLISFWKKWINPELKL